MSERNVGEAGSRWTAAADAASPEFDTRTRTDLLEIARARQVPDADLMRRDELIAVLQKSAPRHAPGNGSPTTTDTSDALETLSRGELLQMAQARNIAGSGAMSRAALVAALASHAERPTTVANPPIRAGQPSGAEVPQAQAPGPAPADRFMPIPEVIPAVAAGRAASSGGDVRRTAGRPPSPPPPGSDVGRKRGISDSLPPRRVLIPGVILCFALLGAGLAAGSELGGTAGA